MKNIKNIDGVGSKFTGKMRVINKSVDNNGTTYIRVGNDEFYAEDKVENWMFKSDRYDNVSKGQEVMVNYNSWDGLVIRGTKIGIYDFAYSRMSEEEKQKWGKVRKDNNQHVEIY